MASLGSLANEVSSLRIETRARAGGGSGFLGQHAGPAGQLVSGSAFDFEDRRDERATTAGLSLTDAQCNYRRLRANSAPFCGRWKAVTGLLASALIHSTAKARFTPAWISVRLRSTGDSASRGWLSSLIFGRYGRAITIDHGHGITTRYGHLASFAVFPGQHVHRGDTIGVGDSGRGTGPHLHYEVRINDIPVNPHKYLRVTYAHVGGFAAGS